LVALRLVDHFDLLFAILSAGAALIRPGSRAGCHGASVLLTIFRECAATMGAILRVIEPVRLRKE
jgi:hypothetical protein